MKQLCSISIFLCLLAFPAALAADEPIDWEMVNRIRDEGFNRSRVMETLRYLTDTIGPRLTGSPALKEANDWTRDQLEQWGLENAQLEPWGPFGRGWSFSRSSAHMLEPRQVPLMALPRGWTPGTEGPIQGTAMKVEIESEEDFEDYRGELEGKILLLAGSREIKSPEESGFERYSPGELAELAEFEIPPEEREEWIVKARERYKLSKALNEFLVAEGALATLDISSRDNGIIRLRSAGSREPGESVGVPSLAVAAEQYNWLVRLLEDDVEVVLEIDVVTQFHDDDLMDYNTLAEIPGTDKRDEIVMVGGHLDSWHPGTGSNDNASGCAVAMEAVRILQALGVRPRRTIRIGLWGGEEQGYLGSRSHIAEHYATRPEPEDPEERELPFYLWDQQWPIETKPAHAKLSGYFNLDNGSGKIRGVYTQGNAAMTLIFEAWLEPFHDLGADTVTNRDTGGTDHIPFDRVGLPGFQFIQDKLDYFTRTHHSNLDVYDHAQREDLIQASVIMASFAYHAAMRDDMLPREPMPQEPPEKDDKEEEDEEQ
ncbi:MAG: M20/M25/M40 family metallo-hydrolase [Thermoanaerobaculia bacterium]